METYKPDVVIIEEPPYVKNLKTYAVLCVYLGCLRSVISELEDLAPRVLIRNNKWTKRELLGNGSASKEEVMRYVVEKFDLTEVGITQDEADACMYALLGR